jgi:hypothetical protein
MNAFAPLAEGGRSMVMPAHAAEAVGLMEHSDFKIGDEFWFADNQLWLCTDKGTRVIVAIRLDRIEVGSTVPGLRRFLCRTEAEADGWFNGPPYAVSEVAFDEYEQEGCFAVEAGSDPRP